MHNKFFHNKFFPLSKSSKRRRGNANTHEKAKEKPLVILDTSEETYEKDKEKPLVIHDTSKEWCCPTSPNVARTRRRTFIVIDDDETAEEGCFSNMAWKDKGKTKVTSFGIDTTADEGYLLQITLKKAINPDPLSGAFYPFNGRDEARYTVIISDGYKEYFRATSVAKPFMFGKPFPHPSWDLPFKVYFDEYPLDETLYLEIVEENCSGDKIASSNGSKVVGRTRITMPKELGSVERLEPLVREVGEEKNIGGLVEYNLRLSKERNWNRWQYIY